MKKIIILTILLFSQFAGANSQKESCYNQLSQEMEKARAEVLCSNVEIDSDITSKSDCFTNLSNTLNKDRAAELCSESTIGAWVVLKNIY